MSNTSMRRVFAFCTALIMLLSVVGCSEKEESSESGVNGGLEDNIIDDLYDNYYEIFVYSFRDTDGDGIGDLKGVTEKLDYIRDMGYTGIWLMPICESPSYHKYDVVDYESIDPAYGTLEDFQELVAAAHEKGIRVIIDLVVNHTSSEHPWFVEALSAAQSGNTDEKYYEYYNFRDSAEAGYTENGGIYYEAQFSEYMPDLNLDSDAVRGEIAEIIKFWLSDMDVDGFRLDACTSYYTGNTEKSADFTGWVREVTTEIKPDAYIVGEVWDSRETIASFYSGSGATFFYFPMSQADGFINKTLQSDTPADLFTANMEAMTEAADGGICVPFLDNHDTGRAGSFLSRDAAKIKFAYGLSGIISGNLFTYYGDEIGMIGSQNDPNKRIGMLWNTDEETTDPPPGATTVEYAFDGVAQQQEDSESILNYYRDVNRIRNAFPSVMRGTAERVDYDSETILLLRKTYEDESVLIAVNFSEEPADVTLDGSFELAAQLLTEGEMSLDGNALSMPARSIAVLSIGD